MQPMIKTYLTLALVLAFIQANDTSYGQGGTMHKSDSVTTARHPGFIPYGIVNIFYNPIGFCQVAAVGNVTYDESSGFQGAGIYNTAAAHSGMQLAGIINTSNTSSGMQLGGLINQTTKGNCGQVAGLINNAHEASGFQIAGLISLNTAKQEMQISGLVNNAGEARFQLAGIVNNSAGKTDLQIAGIINQCDSATSVQVAGLVNRAPFFSGLQIGLVNIADSCSGVPVGLINIIKKNGYFRFELSADEVFYVNAALRSGLKRLYGIALVGWQPGDYPNVMWTLGTGMGTLSPLGKKTDLDVDVVYYQVFRNFYEGDNSMLRLNVGLDHRITPKVSVYGGLTWNLLMTDNRQHHFQDVYDDMTPYYLVEVDNWHRNYKTWIGIKAGIRFH